ncbi:MAG: hypothetical protein GXY85_09655 [Candidatus Brocadiaceae bacterium]|nr:hypothetical protein [Candidatus Brocadiaceae bacterium]
MRNAATGTSHPIGRRITRENLRRICAGGCKPDQCYEAASDPSVIFG